MWGESEIYLVNVTVIIFMLLNMLDMGLRLKLHGAIEGLLNKRFVVLTLVWGYLACPALAYALTRVLPLERSYASGMILVAMAPGSTFLSAMVNKARGDLFCAAPFLLLTSVATVAYMPFAVPLLAKGLSVDAWTIGKPLLLLIAFPLMVGVAAQSVLPLVASRVAPFLSRAVKFLGFFLVTIVFSTEVYARGLLNSIGAYALVTQLLFYSMSSAASYWFSPGLKEGQKSVLSLGLSMRNLGAAFAPLLAIQHLDQEAMVMVTLAIPIQVLISSFAAHLFARRVLTVGTPG